MTNHTKTSAETVQTSQGGYDKVNRLTRSEAKKTGREKRIGFWERLVLKIKGRADGKIGLPRADKDSEYPSSPFLTEEAKSFNKTETLLWSSIQRELWPKYSEARKIIDDMDDAAEKIRYVKSQLPPYPSEEELTVAKPGEEKIDSSARRARRLKTYDNKNARISAEIYSQIGRISSDADRLTSIYNAISEVEKSARLLSSSHEDRCLQRISVYWRAALRKNTKLPPAPEMSLDKAGEQYYDTLHQEYHAKIKAALKDKYIVGE